MKLFKGESGASAVEYGLLVALIAVTIIGAVMFWGGALNERINHPEKAITSAPPK